MGSVKRPPADPPAPLPPPQPRPEIRGWALHETILIPANDSQEVTAPAFVRAHLQRWEAFAAATTGKSDLRVAQLTPGSLRVIFGSSKVSHQNIVKKFERLIACGDDIELLEREASGSLAPAYFDLVRFLSTAKCALSVRPIVDSKHALAIPVRLATAQAAAMAIPTSSSSELRLTARVTSASIKGPIELHYEGSDQAMFVLPGSRHLIKGLRIGGEYTFEIVRTERKENPSAQTRIEIEIRDATQALPDELNTRPRLITSKARKVKPVSWEKRLASTDAMRSASGKSRPYVPLTKSRQDIDHRTWFREELFGHLIWERAPKAKFGDVAFAEMSVSARGVSLGIDTVMLSHLPSRNVHHNAPTTYLHWSSLLRKLLTDNVMTGMRLILERDKDARLSLRFEEDEGTE